MILKLLLNENGVNLIIFTLISTKIPKGIFVYQFLAMSRALTLLVVRFLNIYGRLLSNFKQAITCTTTEIQTMLLECVYSFPGRGKEERKEGLKNTGKFGLERESLDKTKSTN